MGTFVAGPMSLASARGVAQWLASSRTAFDELVASGRAKEFDGMAEFLDASEDFRLAFQSATDAAVRSGQDPVTLRIPMTAAEQRLLGATGTAMQNYMEILGMRGLENVAPGPEATEGLILLAQGVLEE